MNKLKFLHFNNPKVDKRTPRRLFKLHQNRTVAVYIHSKDKIIEHALGFAISKFDESYLVEMNVGVTLVSRDDNYSKQKGREESIKQLEEVKLKVTGLTINEKHMFVHLEPYKGVLLHLRLNKKTGFATVTGEIYGRET